MTKIKCYTNLDLDPRERWPSILPERPQVGDIIESSHEWPGKIRIRLRVCCITWKYSDHIVEWYLSVELHLEKHLESIQDWINWYGLVRSGRVGEQDGERQERDRAAAPEPSPLKRKSQV